MNTFFELYFGSRKGGINLLKALKDLKVAELTILKNEIELCQGRIFILGNGGSYDNARWMTQLLRKNGFRAKTPGDEEDYILTIISKGYSEIFAEALKQDELCEEDLLIGISGSGNSENVIRALKYAEQQGAHIFALGGRDGGRMREMLGGKSCLLAENRCMEAIEDIHTFAFAIVLEAIQKEESLGIVQESFVKSLREFMNFTNMNHLSVLATQMLRTINSSGSVFIMGLGIGANHFRADMGRGATNALPIRGLRCPEVFTMNSLQATANDDGTNFLLVDGLAKFNPGPDDFAIICQTGAEALNLCDDYLRRRQVPVLEIGGNGISVGCFSDDYFDLVVTMTGHACGQVIRSYLGKKFEVKPLKNGVEFQGTQKKMTIHETLGLEKKLKEQGMLKHSEALTFCYGKAFAVRARSEYCREFY